MSNKDTGILKKLFMKTPKHKEEAKEGAIRVNVTLMDKKFEADDLVGSAIILKHLLEIFGEQKKCRGF